MTMIANITIGDTSCSVYRVDPIKPIHEADHYYEVHFVDLPTRKMDFLRTDSENQALMLFAAWIAMDEEDMSNYKADLAANLTKEFLP